MPKFQGVNTPVCPSPQSLRHCCASTNVARGLGYNLGENKMAAKGSVLCHVEKNLKALEKLPRVALDNIKDFPEAFRTVSTSVYVFLF